MCNKAAPGPPHSKANAGWEYMVIQVRILVRPKVFGRITTATWCQKLSPILSPPIYGVNTGRTTSTNQSHVEKETPAVTTACSMSFQSCHPSFGVRRPGAALVDDEFQFERLRVIERICHLAFIIHYFSFQKIGRVY
jgi:hypothetical protein